MWKNWKLINLFPYPPEKAESFPSTVKEVFVLLTTTCAKRIYVFTQTFCIFTVGFERHDPHVTEVNNILIAKEFFSKPPGNGKTGYGSFIPALAFTKQALFSAAHAIVAMHTDRALTMLFWHLSISPSVQYSLFVFLSLVFGPNAKKPLCDSELIVCAPIWKGNARVCRVSPGDLSKRLSAVNPIPWPALNYLWFEGSLVNHQSCPFH